ISDRTETASTDRNRLVQCDDNAPRGENRRALLADVAVSRQDECARRICSARQPCERGRVGVFGMTNDEIDRMLEPGSRDERADAEGVWLACDVFDSSREPQRCSETL